MATTAQATRLPIDGILPAILAALSQNPNLVIEAPPGAGKTTRVPAALLGLVTGGIIVLEPRRIAARLAARRVASELGEEVGATVGYQVRFEDVSSERTRLRFVTEGVLTRRLLSDPELRGVDVVVLDEFHERHLDGDLALALLKRLQATRPTLRIVVMSATLDAAPIAKFLNECPVLQSEGRMFPLEVRHLPYSPAPLESQVKHALSELIREGHTGHTLVFLPGVAEIRRAIRECEALGQRADLVLLPLYGELSPAEQDRALGQSVQKKVIFATNVAESSVTVDGVTAVIDSGLARRASFSPWTGLPTLELARISKASAQQRAGRAGRTAPGLVLRLYPEADFAQRPDHDLPELLRADLSQMCLMLRASRNATLQHLEWLDPPPDVAMHNANVLLDRLGAFGDQAREMVRLPVSPRLSRVLLEAKRRGVGEAGCKIAALLTSGARSAQTDLLAATEAPMDARTQQLLQQIRRIAKPAHGKGSQDESILLAVLAGFPDRVGKIRAGKQALLSSGGSAELDGSDLSSEFFVAVDIEDRKDKPLPLIRMTARIEPEWLIDLFPERVRETETLVWHREGERVEAVSALMYDDLVLQETRGLPQDAAAATELLVQKAVEASVGRFIDGEQLQQLQARIDFAGLAQPDVGAVLLEVAHGLRSFSALKEAALGVLSLMESRAGTQLLQSRAPTSVRLQGGRQTKIHYEDGKPPWIESRLQNFFGMRETPRIGAEKTPVVVHLLAPNKRAVQTTTDLAGFWVRLYPTVRKELMRRYPRHSWPENPA